MQVPRYPLAAHNIPCLTQLGLDSEKLSILPSKKASAAAAAAGRPLALRLRELIVLDNFDGIFEGIFGGGNEIRLVSLVNDGTSKEPFKFEVGTFNGIKPKAPLPLGDKGLLLYYAEPENLPPFIDWRLLIVEDDSDVRDLGLMLKDLQKTQGYQDALGAVLNLVNPTVAAVVGLTNTVIGLVAHLMEQNRDDIISLFAATYTREFDNMGVGTHTFYHEGHSRATYEILLAN